MNWYKKAQENLVYYRGTRNKTDDPYIENNMIFLSPNKEFTTTYGDNTYEYNVDNSSIIIDTSVGDDYLLFMEFIKETGKDYYRAQGKGKGILPFWTAQKDFTEWLNHKGIQYDGIYFAENNGSCSLALKNRSKLIPLKDKI